MPVDFFATERHYYEHMRPVWDALEPDERGTFYVYDRGMRDLPHSPGHFYARPEPASRPVVTCSYGDYQHTAGRRVIYAEHGAGQNYLNANRAYAGAAERERVVLFLNPNEHTAQANLRAHPTVPSVVVGFPYLDRFEPRKRNGRTVAFSWHWQNGYWPASCSAFRHYKRALPAAIDRLRGDGWEVIGTAHPRAWLKNPKVGPWYEQHGIEAVHDLAEVIERADVLCADNTSAQWLTAALGIGQVVLDCSDYRHGYAEALWPRFTVPFGVRVTDASQIPNAVGLAPVDDVSEVVPFVGGAAERAVQAIRAYVL